MKRDHRPLLRRPARLLQEMAELGWSQAQLAHQLGVTNATVLRWSNGVTRPPKLVALWVRYMCQHRRKHPPPSYIRGRWCKAIHRQSDIPQLAQEQQRDADRITVGAGDNPPVPSDDAVADRHSVPWHVYRPPGS